MRAARQCRTARCEGAMIRWPWQRPATSPEKGYPMRSGLTSRALILALAVCGVGLVPSTANADKPAPKSAAPTNQQHAAELFKKSVEAYRRGDFKEAIELLNEAYGLDPQ